MSPTFAQILQLVVNGEIKIPAHGYDELAANGIFVRDIVASVTEALVVEDYPNFHKGPCVLVLQWNSQQQPIHVVWGIAKGTSSPAVVITPYRPDPMKWSSDFRSRL